MRGAGAVEVGVPRVVGAGRVGLEVVRSRSAPWRGARVRSHGV